MRRTEGKSLSGFRLPSLSLPDISTATSDNSLKCSVAAGKLLVGKPIMPESLEVNTARRKASVSEEDWSSQHFLSNQHRVGSWNTSLDSVTVRPVSPKIFSLCSKFVSSSDNNELSTDSKDQLTIHNSRARSKSFTLASISDDQKSPEQLSSLFIRRSSSPKPLKINLAPPEIYSIDPESGGLFPKQLLSPSTSPSSGYGSGFNSSSPVCMSPRSHSPTLDSQLQREPSDEKSSLSVVPQEQTRTRRSISHDSGVSRLSVESPSCIGRSSSEEEPCPESRSKVRSMHSHCGGNFTIQVPKPVRPQLVKTKPVFHLYPPGSPTNATVQPEILSPDEGFQDLRLPLEQPSSSVPTSHPPPPLSPAHADIKRTELRVRLNPPGSPLPTRIHETIPGLSRRFSEQGILDQDGDEKPLSSATCTEEQRVPSSPTESKPFIKSDTVPPALVIEMCETPPRSEQSSPPPGAFNSNSGSNLNRPYQFLTLADIESGTLHRKLSTDSTLSSFSQASTDDDLDDHLSIAVTESAPLPTSAKAPFTAAGKRAQFSSVSISSDTLAFSCENFSP
ncbi:uncharacterized protein LOC129264940 [Lytechinus pictus]|uniref:uncharacterized protein LOC129264940 n=1 Tax=Lytechinus pictus TaxID=7653 RepID=UPI00240D02F3|nr:uncharacterized protein LOC129264940 [Lytechinus pictus]